MTEQRFTIAEGVLAAYQWLCARNMPAGTDAKDGFETVAVSGVLCKKYGRRKGLHFYSTLVRLGLIKSLGRVKGAKFRFQVLPLPIKYATVEDKPLRRVRGRARAAKNGTKHQPVVRRRKRRRASSKVVPATATIVRRTKRGQGATRHTAPSAMKLTVGARVALMQTLVAQFRQHNEALAAENLRAEVDKKTGVVALFPLS